ncbi:TonB-dependent receptor [Hankyongella ginsenosidimutans]|uniref:TonB-dependent receptor n=1 Tax=Hankyongella ginsenosidimutans TaxID=1763828 RepID=UPI001CA337BF|nr:TonB-dependent receptor [Hankyongella ginsenosidimutans]
MFNPPHWRGRATVAWNREAVTVAAAFNYTGGVRDIRSNPAVNIRGVSTVDLTIRFAPTRIAQALRGVEFSARLLNAFNAKPQQIATTAFSDSAYDSTNYSPAGRVIGLGIVKTW